MRRDICIYCGRSSALKKDGTLKKHQHDSKDCPGSNHQPVGIQAVRNFIAKHERIASDAEDQETVKAHCEIADKVADRHRNLLKLSADEIDLTPYFEMKLGEHLKTTERIMNHETSEYEWRLFDLEVIATEENGVWFQVWSFSFAHFCDDGEYHDNINHGVSYVDITSLGCPLTVLSYATARHIDWNGTLKKSYTRKPYLANR